MCSQNTCSKQKTHCKSAIASIIRYPFSRLNRSNLVMHTPLINRSKIKPLSKKKCFVLDVSFNMNRLEKTFNLEVSFVTEIFKLFLGTTD